MITFSDFRQKLCRINFGASPTAEALKYFIESGLEPDWKHSLINKSNPAVPLTIYKDNYGASYEAFTLIMERRSNVYLRLRKRRASGYGNDNLTIYPIIRINVPKIENIELE